MTLNSPAELDALDREIVNRMQKEVPLVERPFEALGRAFQITEAELLERVRRLERIGLIRRLGPILNYPAWGMRGTLVAANVDPSRIEEVKAIMQDYPAITHAYLRDHPWNLWFTVIAESKEAMEAVVRRVEERAGLKDVRKLERMKTFKLKVEFKT